MVCILCSGSSTLSVCSFKKLDTFAEMLKTLLPWYFFLTTLQIFLLFYFFFAPLELLGELEICTLCATHYLLNCVCVLYPSSQPTSPTTPNKPMVPLDWASGFNTKPDPSVVNKHIRKVVDVSRQHPFSNYTYRMQKTARLVRCRYVCVTCFLSMGKSVFRNYDHDHDGYISQEDFESIAANFPFLDSFCVLDKDQWV